MDFIQIIGLLAGTLTTVSFLPQVIAISKTKSTQGISLGMFVIFLLGVSMWLIYGLYLGSFPIIFFNAITAFLVLIILYYKLKY